MRMNTEVLWLGFQPCRLEPRHNSIFLQSHHLEGWDKKITVNPWLAWLTVSSRPASAIQSKILSHYLPLSPCQKKKPQKLEIPHSPIKNFTEKGMVTFVINRGTHHPAGLPRHPCHALPLPLPPPPPLPHPPAPRPGPGLDRSLRQIRLTWLPEVLSGHYRLMVHCRGPKRRTRGINQNHKVSFTSTNHPKEKKRHWGWIPLGLLKQGKLTKPESESSLSTLPWYIFCCVCPVQAHQGLLWQESNNHKIKTECLRIPLITPSFYSFQFPESRPLCLHLHIYTYVCIYF